MTIATKDFCKIVRQRSRENADAMKRLCEAGPPIVGPAFGLLRTELDSMVRVIFLLRIADMEERRRLIQSTLDGSLWQMETPKGKTRRVTDREMVDLAQQLQGWTQSAYKFGCAFIHLSNFHNHLAENPFETLSTRERDDILRHMRNYHGGPASDHPGMEEIASYIPSIFEKVRGNLEHYVKYLSEERGQLF